MDIEALTKLSELKEKGLLSQEEFEKQKAALLSGRIENQVSTKNKKGINWKNVGLSFLMALLWVFFVLFISGMFSVVVDDSTILSILLIVTAVLLSIIASNLETQKYKNCCPAWEIFIGIILLQAFGVWIALYEFLQIKQGNVTLKE